MFFRPSAIIAPFITRARTAWPLTRHRTINRVSPLLVSHNHAHAAFVTMDLWCIALFRKTTDAQISLITFIHMSGDCCVRLMLRSAQ